MTIPAAQPPPSLPQPRIVLFESTHPGNVGAAARAMKTMGFHNLMLVNPRCDHVDGEGRARAAGAADVLENARVVPRLMDAVSDCGLVVAASARHRRLGVPEFTPREWAPRLLAAVATAPVAVVFGPERSGLTNEELDLCHGILYIPGNPAYTSLNLAMAVQIVAWELRMVEPFGAGEAPPESPPASTEGMDLFYEHLERVLLVRGFLNPDNPRHLMRRLRRLFNRAQLDENELNILRGILAAVAPGSGERDWTGP